MMLKLETDANADADGNVDAYAILNLFHTPGNPF